MEMIFFENKSFEEIKLFIKELCELTGDEWKVRFTENGATIINLSEKRMEILTALLLSSLDE